MDRSALQPEWLLTKLNPPKVRYYRLVRYLGLLHLTVFTGRNQLSCRALSALLYE